MLSNHIFHAQWDSVMCHHISLSSSNPACSIFWGDGSEVVKILFHNLFLSAWKKGEPPGARCLHHFECGFDCTEKPGDISLLSLFIYLLFFLPVFCMCNLMLWMKKLQCCKCFVYLCLHVFLSFTHCLLLLCRFSHFMLHSLGFVCLVPVDNVSVVSSDVQVTIACDAVLNAPSAYKKPEPESWEEEIQVSRHARSLRQLDNGVRVPPR